jgi:hypothetical protein
MREIRFIGQSSLRWRFAGGLAIVMFLSLESSIAEIINQQKNAVVFIFGTIHPLNPDKSPIRGGDGKPAAVEVPLGTGFFVRYKDEASGKEICYLVTARHVLQDMDGTLLPSVKLRMNLKSPTGEIKYGYIDHVPVGDGDGNLLWLHSGDPAADVAMLPLLPDSNMFEYASISNRDFLSNAALQSGSVNEGDDLYFIGMMAQYYGAERNYPLVRHGTLAMLTDEKIDTPTGPQKVFIAELESWPGNSGSPVFLEETSRLEGAAQSFRKRHAEERNIHHRNAPVFLGVVVASFLNKVTVPLGGGRAGRQLQAGDTANTGVTCVVPASVLAEILDSDAARENRAEIIEGQTVTR